MPRSWRTSGLELAERGRRAVGRCAEPNAASLSEGRHGNRSRAPALPEALHVESRRPDRLTRPSSAKGRAAVHGSTRLDRVPNFLDRGGASFEAFDSTKFQGGEMRIGRKASLVTLLVAGGLVLGSVAAFAQLTPYDPLSLEWISRPRCRGCSRMVWFQSALMRVLPKVPSAICSRMLRFSGPRICSSQSVLVGACAQPWSQYFTRRKGRFPRSALPIARARHLRGFAIRFGLLRSRTHRFTAPT